MKTKKVYSTPQVRVVVFDFKPALLVGSDGNGGGGLPGGDTHDF